MGRAKLRMELILKEKARITTYHKRKRADKVFFAELNEVLPKELVKDGSSGVEVRVTCEKRRRIPELKSLIQKRFKFPKTVWSFTPNELTTEGSIPLPMLSHCEFVIQASRRACCPQLIVCMACYGVLGFILENEAKGA
nr:hypothetical protein [Tanacetum cinerariifolium]